MPIRNYFVLLYSFSLHIPIKMKNKRLAIYLAFLSLLTLCSCNNDVFVDELKASATEIEMNGDGDSTTIHTNTSDWKIWSVEDASNPEGNKFRGVVYDEDEDMKGNYDVEFYLINKAKGKLVYTGRQNGFTVNRSKDNTIDISVDENLLDSAFKFTVWICDAYKAVPIHITQTASSGYTFDHITYQYLPNSYHQEWDGTSITINNEGDTLRTDISVFSGKHRKIQFSSDNPKAFSYLSNLQQIETPIQKKDDALLFSNEKSTYLSKAQEVRLPFDDVKQAIVLPPGKSELRMVIAYEYFDAAYTLYVRNNKTGLTKSVNGIFHSKTPLNTEYFVFVNDKWQR